MPSHAVLPNEQNALCRVVAGVGAAYISNFGFTAAPARTGAGVHRCTLATPMPMANMAIEVSRSSGLFGGIGWQIIDEQTIDVHTFDALGAPADVNFCLTVRRIP